MNTATLIIPVVQFIKCLVKNKKADHRFLSPVLILHVCCFIGEFNIRPTDSLQLCVYNDAYKCASLHLNEMFWLKFRYYVNRQIMQV